MSQESLARELVHEGRRASSVEGAKAAAVTFLTELLDETDAMLKKIDAAGTPAGEQGEEVRRVMRTRQGN